MVKKLPYSLRGHKWAPLSVLVFLIVLLCLFFDKIILHVQEELDYCTTMEEAFNSPEAVDLFVKIHAFFLN